MKNLMVANLSKGRYKFDNIDLLLKAQIDNSLGLGWKVEDIILLANFDYSFMGVTSVKIDLNKNCLTGSKMFGLEYLFNNALVNDNIWAHDNDNTIWAHDLDAWQNSAFDCPDFQDVGIATYSNSKFNGGSTFWKKSSEDIARAIVQAIRENSENKEEPTLNKVLKSREYSDRVTTLNSTFNVGCSGYVKRWVRSEKPVKVCHFHPYNHIAWETHALDRNGLGVKGISDDLEKVLRKYYVGLATELSGAGKLAQKERKEAYKGLVASFSV